MLFYLTPSAKIRSNLKSNYLIFKANRWNNILNKFKDIQVDQNLGNIRVEVLQIEVIKIDNLEIINIIMIIMIDKKNLIGFLAKIQKDL